MAIVVYHQRWLVVPSSVLERQKNGVVTRRKLRKWAARRARKTNKAKAVSAPSGTSFEAHFNKAMEAVALECAPFVTNDVRMASSQSVHAVAPSATAARSVKAVIGNKGSGRAEECKPPGPKHPSFVDPFESV